MATQHITNILDRTARILAHRAGVRVVFRGNATPQTDGLTIFLPTLPQPCPDAVERVWHGLIDHETSHILFSDFDEIARFKQKYGERYFVILNILEDLRCESRMMLEYPGCAENFERSYEYALERWSNAVNSMPLFDRVLGCLFATGKGWSIAMFGEDAGRIVDCVKDLVLSAPDTASTAAAADLASQIIERLNGYLDILNGNQEESTNNLPALIEEFNGSSSKGNVFTLGEVLGQTLQESSCKDTDRPYRVYSYENDLIETARDMGGESYTQFDDVRPLVSGLRQKLIMSLQGRSQCRLVPSENGTKINRKKIHTICIDSTPLPFLKKSEAPSNDVAVMLLVDQSGSMKGERIKLGQKCCILLAETMDQLHYPLSVVGFTTTHDRSYLSTIRLSESQTVEQIEAEFARYVPLQFTVFKEFNESLRKSRGRFTSMQARYYTPINEAVLYAGKKLMDVKASRRLLIILTDGSCYLGNKETQAIAERNLRDNLQQLRLAGIEVLAIGIQSASVKDVFWESIVVNELAQLPQQFYQAVAHKILR